jgi:spore coat polysaccharide biosynthesis predicted glycosyltransferase SpsG/RimJ/RimL family protein N-acetyltransferase
VNVQLNQTGLVKNAKRLNIRVDSSMRIGSGHVSRCIAIAEEAVSLGHEVRFLFRDLVGSKTEEMVSKRFEYLALDREVKFEEQLGSIESMWPEDEQILDARIIQQLLYDQENEILLVDHYGLGENFTQYLREGCTSTSVYFLHDFKTSNCTNSCIHPGIASPSSLASIIAEGNNETRFLLNQSMVPLSKAVRTSNKNENSKDLPGGTRESRIFIDFGTSEVENFVDMICTALPGVAKKFPISVTALQPREPEQNRKLEKSENTDVPSLSYVKFESQSSYLDFVQSQDLVIGAGGVSCLERLYLGIPQIVFSISDNQIELVKSLSDWKAIHSGGIMELNSPQMLCNLIIGALENLDLLAQSAKGGQLQIDGYGAHRIAHLLLGNESSELTIRKIRSDDAPLLFGWANDPQLRRNSISRKVIYPQEHLNWFEDALNSPDRAIFILELGPNPVGQSRFMREVDNTFVLSYSIDSVYRGTGLAKKLLSLSIEAHRAKNPAGVYHATIRSDNFASRAALTSLGFTLTETDQNIERFVLS